MNDDTRMRQIATEVYNSLGTRFGIAKVPAHIHNGQDVNRISFPNLENSGQYRAISRITLSSAMLKTLNTTPVELIPTQGPNSIIIVEGVEAYLSYKGTAYVHFDSLNFYYYTLATAVIGAEVIKPISGLLSYAGSIYAHSTSSEYVPYTALGGETIILTSDSDPTTGNSPVTFQLTYRVVNLKS